MLELDRPSSFDFSDVAGVPQPLRKKLETSGKVQAPKKPKATVDDVKILTENKKLIGKGYDGQELVGDVVEIPTKSGEKDRGEEEVSFTIAPPFIDKEDTQTIYENTNKTSRFKSPTQGVKGQTTIKWDGKELVNEQILDRQQVKDVKSASQRLIDYSPLEGLNIDTKAMQNPIYRQSVYGAEGESSFGKKKQSKEETPPPHVSDGYYIPPVSVPKYAKPGDFLFGKEAYQHYINIKRELDKIEKEEIEPEIEYLRRRIIAKQYQIEEVAAKAKEYYCAEYKPRQSLKERFLPVKKYLTDVDFNGPATLQKGFSETNIRARLESVTDHSPWVIFLIVALQAVAMSILCATAGVIPPRLSPHRIVVGEIMTWDGVKSIEHFIPPNMWAGPSHAQLIQSGALYAPCVRRDKYRLLRNAIHDAAASELGCCQAKGRGAGTTTEQECDELKTMFQIEDIEWINVTCSTRDKTVKTGLHVPHDFKPCCISTKGDCLLVTHKHCVILDGVWYISEFEHCSQANCDGNLCKIYESSDTVDAVSSPIQFWRLPLSVLFHEGIISAVLFGLFVQTSIAVEVEHMAGWLRMIVIYMICGVGGLLFGSIVVPYVPNTGTGGAICGFISILAVDLVQSWPLVNKKLQAVLKLLGLYALMAIAGLFPGVNQFTNIAGAVLGVLVSLSFMPYIAFTERHRQVMIVLRIVSSIILVIVITLLFYAFYVAQPNYEGSLQFLNCLAFVNFSCDTTLP